MKALFGLTVGFLGICFIPLAIVFVAFRASCTFVGRLAMDGIKNVD